MLRWGCFPTSFSHSLTTLCTTDILKYFLWNGTPEGLASLLGASQHFGLDRKTIREWRDRYRAEGVASLVPRYPAQRPSRLAPATIALLEHARRELEYGAARTRVWLRRVGR